MVYFIMADILASPGSIVHESTTASIALLRHDWS